MEGGIGQGPSPTLLDECLGRQLPAARVGILLVGVLPVVVPLQGARDVAGVMAVGTAERLQGKAEREARGRTTQPFSTSSPTWRFLAPESLSHLCDIVGHPVGNPDRRNIESCLWAAHRVPKVGIPSEKQFASSISSYCFANPRI